MKRLALTAGMVVAIALFGSPITALAAEAQMVDCSGSPGWCFSPITITIPVGASVTWTNSSSAPHTATSDDLTWTAGTFASPINLGSSGTVTFTTAGTYTYHCAIHPTIAHGTIVVTAAAVVSPSPSVAASPSRAPSVKPSHPRRLPRTGGPPTPLWAAGPLLAGAALVGLGLLVRRSRTRLP